MKMPARSGRFHRAFSLRLRQWSAALGVFPGNAGDVAAGQADVGKLAVIEPRKFPQAVIVAAPGAQRVEDCNEHVLFLSRTRKLCTPYITAIVQCKSHVGLFPAMQNYHGSKCRVLLLLQVVRPGGANWLRRTKCQP